MQRAPDLSGTALDGRYELHALIGEGTFGRVYRGRDRRLARRVAVKVIKPWWAEDPEWVRSFEREAQLLASISDPGIVQIFDVGFAPEGLYYVAELVDGESLAGRLRRGPLAPSGACDIAHQLARALARAHAQRVVHRDVKPANVLIAADGRVKVGDFGVARLAEGTGEGPASTVAGTPQYMAPEQARGAGTSPATDVYGIGVVLYEMLAGKPPFAGRSAVELAMRHVHDPPPALPPEIPLELVRIVERALAKAPIDRYADGGEMAGALEEIRHSIVGGVQERDVADVPDTPAPGGGVALLAPPTARTVVRIDLDAAPRLPAAPAPVAATRVGDPLAPRRNFNPVEQRQRAAIFALVVLIALGMVAAAIALSPGHLRVPKLRGLTRARIATEAHRMDFRTAYSSRYSAATRGSAIAQSPSPGTRVTEGTTVRVVLSAGPAPVSVPKLLGRPLPDAEAVLDALKLRANVIRVPAPGIAPATVTHESPAAGASRAPGSVVTLSVAQAPRLRYLTGFSGDGQGQSVPFRIRGSRWQIIASMSFRGTCTFIFVCSGPSAKVINASGGATVDGFDLGEGDRQIRTVNSGPGVYQVLISPGSDTARWSVAIEDYY